MLRFSFKRYRMCILVEHFTFVYWKQINRYTSQQLLCYSKGSFVLSLYKENLKKGAEIHMKKLFFQVRNDFQWVLIILFSSLYIEYILLTFEHMKRMKPRDLKVDNLLLEFQPPTLYFAHAYIYIYIYRKLNNKNFPLSSTHVVEFFTFYMPFVPFLSIPTTCKLGQPGKSQKSKLFAGDMLCGLVWCIYETFALYF